MTNINPLTTVREGIVNAIKTNVLTIDRFKRFYFFDDKSENEIEPSAQELPAIAVEYDSRGGSSVKATSTTDIAATCLIRIWTDWHYLPDIEEEMFRVLKVTRMNRSLLTLATFGNTDISLMRGRLKVSGDQRQGHPVMQARIVIPFVVRVC